MFNIHFLKMLLLWIIIIGAGIYTLFLIDEGEYVANFFAKEVSHLDSIFHPGAEKDTENPEI